MSVDNNSLFAFFSYFALNQVQNSLFRDIISAVIL